MQRHKQEQFQQQQIHICLPYAMKNFVQNTGASKRLSGLEILIFSYSSLTPTNALTLAWQQKLDPVRIAAFTTHTLAVAVTKHFLLASALRPGHISSSPSQPSCLFSHSSQVRSYSLMFLNKNRTG